MQDICLTVYSIVKAKYHIWNYHQISSMFIKHACQLLLSFAFDPLTNRLTSVYQKLWPVRNYTERDNTMTLERLLKLQLH